MLVLSRHVDQSIVIGDDIEIVILAIRGDLVSIGVRADASIPVDRLEVRERRERERRRPGREGGKP
jgi:carbon storage regulator